MTISKNFFAVLVSIIALVSSASADEPDSLILVMLRPGVYQPFFAAHQLVFSLLDEDATKKIYQARTETTLDTSFGLADDWGWDYQREITPTSRWRIDTVMKAVSLNANALIISYTGKSVDKTFPDYRHRIYLMFIGLVSLIVALRFFKLIRQWLYDYLAVILIINGLMIALYSLGLRHNPPNLIFSWGTVRILFLIGTVVAGLLVFLIERPLKRSYSRHAADPALELYSAIFNGLQIGIVLYAAFFLFAGYWLTSVISTVIIVLLYHGTRIIKGRGVKDEKRETQILIKGGERL